MSRSSITAPPRRVLSDKQADTVDRLADAAVDELRQHGYDGLTVRNVARRAGVAAATAYTYFASKDHLVAEVFWRRLDALPRPGVDLGRSPRHRVAAALTGTGMLVADEPELAAACTTAILSNEPNVRRVRDAIGADIADRLAEALGPDGSPEILRLLTLVYSGALVQAGMGNLEYGDLSGRMDEAAGVIFGGEP
ncbi:MAG: TetR family transcriptional regulator [Acidimicrobiales bacterium]